MTGADLVEAALALSGADGCIVIAEESSEATLRFANNTLTTNGFTVSTGVTVVAIVGDSVGTRSATVVDESALPALVAAAEAAAREAPAAEDAGPLLEATGDQGFEAPAEPTDIAVFTQLAGELGEAFRGARADGLLLYGYAYHGSTTTWLGTSSGLRRRHVQPTGYVEVTAKNDRRGGSSWWGRPSHDMTDLSVPEIDRELRRRLDWTSTWHDLPAGRYDTVLPPSAVADLLVDAYWSASGRDAREGRSPYSRPGSGTRVGDFLAPEGVRLWSDPQAAGLQTAPFLTTGGSSSMASVFDNGLPLQTTDWIRGGRLESLVETRATARRAAGVAVTPYIDNLLLDAGGSGSTDDLVATVTDGLLLTCLWYIRVVDPETLLLTGLTRDGVYRIQDGQITGVVNNFRFNESPLDLLGRVDGSSAPEVCLPREWSDYFRWASMPALRIPDFRMSSVSPAT